MRYKYVPYQYTEYQYVLLCHRDNENDEREDDNNEEDDEHDIDHEMHDDDIDCCNFINQSYSKTFQENLCHEYTKVVQPYSAS